MPRKRLLIAATRFPYPAVGGDRVRVFHLCRLLARHFEVELLTLGDPDASDIEGFRSETGVNTVKVVRHSRLRAVSGALRSLVGNEPLQVGYYRNRRFQAEFRRASARADVVLCHLIRSAPLWGDETRTPAALDMCDVISNRFEQMASQGAWWHPWTWISAMEGRRTREFERSQARRFGLVTMVTDTDARMLSMSNDQLLTITQGVDLARYPYVAPSLRMGHHLAFVGRMDTAPNVEAVRWFVRHILPSLPEQVRLKVIGICPRPLAEELASNERVTVTGQVPSIAQACLDCFAGVAPVHVATGIQNKVLEYFALGLPAIITPSVGRGLSPQLQHCSVQASNAHEWVTAVRRLWSDRYSHTGPAISARRFVEVHHNWAVIGNTLGSRLLAMAGDHTLPTWKGALEHKLGGVVSNDSPLPVVGQ